MTKHPETVRVDRPCFCLSMPGKGTEDACAAPSPDGKHRCTYGKGHPIQHHCCYPHLWFTTPESPTR